MGSVTKMGPKVKHGAARLGGAEQNARGALRRGRTFQVAENAMAGSDREYTFWLMGTLAEERRGISWLGSGWRQRRFH
jgi:hypothetical protein